VVKQKFATPTLVQARAIPLALAGRDVLGTSLGLAARLSLMFCSKCENRFRQNCGLCLAHTAIDPQA